LPSRRLAACPSVRAGAVSRGRARRDAQIILGHSRPAVTLETYTHTDDQAPLDALTRLQDLRDDDKDDDEAGN